ncbi:MAG: ABC transporter ATP-binding protein [Syntrophorhabdales bacterium]
MFLQVNNISVRYGKAEALRNVSMKVDKGEIVSLIGSNGAGKTTTLKSISGLVPYYGGEILFQGRRLNGVAPHEIVRMGIAHVPEGRRVFSSMTVTENLELGAYLRNDRASVARDLDRIHKSFPVLNDRAGQKAGSLSGGEQQMLAIARALMASPTVLLLDEPSLGLSPKLVREVARIVSAINSQGVTIILIEQNARMALRLSHRAYILELGQIILEGNAKELINDEKVRKAYLGSTHGHKSEMSMRADE